MKENLGEIFSQHDLQFTISNRQFIQDILFESKNPFIFGI
jgi:hypothetical protein